MKIKAFLSSLQWRREAQVISSHLHVVLLIDCSGSIKEHVKAVKRAALNLADQLREKGKAGVVCYGGKGVQIKSRLTSNRYTLKRAFAGMKAGGTSPMGAAILLTDEEMLREEEALKVIVLFSDGKPTNPESVIDCANKARGRGVWIIPVGVGPTADLDFLRRIASHPEDCYSLPSRENSREIAQEVVTVLSQKEYLPLTTPTPLFLESLESPLDAQEEEAKGTSRSLPEGQPRSKEPGAQPSLKVELERGERVKVKVSVPVDCRCEGQQFTARAIDLGREGISLWSDQKVAVGSRITLRFTLPNSGASALEPLEITGEVLRAAEKTLEVTFVELDSRYQGLITGFIQRAVLEQRRKPRAAIGLKANYNYKDKWIPGQIKDISEGGLFLLTRHPIYPKEDLLLQFFPSDSLVNRPIRVTGEVVRMIRLDPQREGGWPIGLGIKFKSIHSQSKSDFDQYIKKLTS